MPVERRQSPWWIPIVALVISALGLILGSLLTFWIGEETLRAIQRGFRRLTGGDDRPNFEMLLQ